MAITQVAGGKIAELYVFKELLKRGTGVYVPVVDEGVDALARTPDGRLVELQIKSAGSAGGDYPGWFQIAAISPKKNFFVVGIEFSQGEPVSAWVFPSSVFDKYANRPQRGSPRDLDLDGGKRKYGMTLRDLLCGFRNRWELITKFEQYESLLESPEDLEDILAMKESLESNEEEAITLQ